MTDPIHQPPASPAVRLQQVADRALRAVTLRGQAQVAVLASAALTIASAIQPDLSPDLLVLRDVLNTEAIGALLMDLAHGQTMLSDDGLAARLEDLLPARLDALTTGQNDLLRALTRQHAWQQQMLRLQEVDAEAGAALLAAFSTLTGNLEDLRTRLERVATAEQVARLQRLIEEQVLPQLTHLPDLPPPGDLPDPGPLPPGSRIPYHRNPLFTGREEELRALAARLLYQDLSGLGRPDRSEPAARHPSLVVLATGIGGIGKTQLAVEFAHRYGRFFAGGVQWVSLADGNPAAVAREVAECGLSMGLWTLPQEKELSLDERVKLTRRAWAGPELRLVVFDNCDGAPESDNGQPPRDARDLLEAWRPDPGGARLLVTSRSADWPAGVAALAVPALPRAESRALLREYLEAADPPRRESDAALDAVAAELGDLPLALTLAGSYLAAYPDTAVAAYLAELRAPGLLDHASLRGKGRPEAWTKHDLDVERTFRVSLDRLQPDDTTDAAAVRLLAGAACLVPGEPFPRELLTGMAARTPDDEDDDADPHRPDDALRRLLALGLLERAGDGRLRLHRLLAAFAERELAAELDAVRRAMEETVYNTAQKQNKARDPRPLRVWEVHFRHIVEGAFNR